MNGYNSLMETIYFGIILGPNIFDSSTTSSSSTNTSKNNGFGSLLAFRKPFLGRKSKENNNSVDVNKKKKNGTNISLLKL